MPWEEIEHTADLGLRIRASDVTGLLENAALGMFSLIGRADFRRDEVTALDFVVESRTAEELLRDFLRRLLREFDLRGFFPVAFELDSGVTTCRARVEGGRFDPARHEFFTEVKGVTFHGLRVSREEDGS
jgi:SHS2 domain-containing protein